MALFVQWMNEDKLIFSDSEGNLNLVERNDGDYFLSKKKKLHDALSWICHYSNEQKVIYCGSDDGGWTAFDENDLMRDEVHFVGRFEVIFAFFLHFFGFFCTDFALFLLRFAFLPQNFCSTFLHIFIKN
jgi:hypothetical protein